MEYRHYTGELARSIAAVGVIEPCLVMPIDGEPDRYRLVAGHRRHAAAVQAGIAELPCLVRELSEAEVVETQLVENLQRSGLSVLVPSGIATAATFRGANETVLRFLGLARRDIAAVSAGHATRASATDVGIDATMSG